MKIVYIAHAISGDVHKNLAEIGVIIKHIYNDYPDIIPVVPYYATCMALDDADDTMRETGIEWNKEIVYRFPWDEMWLTGETMSKGMEEERDWFIDREINVVNKMGYRLGL